MPNAIGFIGFIFVILKLCNLVTWGWPVVLAPFAINIVIGCALEGYFKGKRKFGA